MSFIKIRLGQPIFNILFYTTTISLFIFPFQSIAVEAKKSNYSGVITQFQVTNFVSFAGSNQSVLLCLDKHPKKCFAISTESAINSGLAEKISGEEDKYSLEKIVNKGIKMNCVKYSGVISPSLLPCPGEFFQCEDIVVLK
jgi:hypothetical protein